MTDFAPVHAPRDACSNPHPTSTSVEDLALQACEEVESLNEVMHGYAALEKLVDASDVSDSDVLTTTRSERSALLRLLNQTLAARVAMSNAASAALREALHSRTATSTA